VIAPGLIVQVPIAGRPFSTTLPVGNAHEEGCISVPTVGADGVTGAGLIIMLADGGDIHPAASVTVKLYVPAISNVIVVLAPVPEIAPGLIVQLPSGSPFNITLPVATEHVG